MIAGRVWKFGDNINTDLMLPGSVIAASEEVQRLAVFSANRPGWSAQVEPGDILIGGQNFGTGSSRPAPRSLRNLGLGCLLAELINGLFFRNAVNLGFLSLECPGVFGAFEEGQVAELSFAAWTVRNRESGQVLPVRPVPEALLAPMRGGGIIPVMERLGYIRLRPTDKPASPSPAS